METNRLWGSVLPLGQERISGSEKEDAKKEEREREIYVQGSLLYISKKEFKEDTPSMRKGDEK